MNNEAYVRTCRLLGPDYPDRIKDKRICVFGIGGVGGHCVDALARFGFRHFALVDHDEVNASNLNRQLVASLSAIGKKKVDVMKEHLLDLSKDMEVETYPYFYGGDDFEIDLSKFDYVVDCIDSVTSKIKLIETCKRLDVPIVSSMGCGNRLDPRGLEVMDIEKTSNDPLAKVMRRELRNRGIKHVIVVCSTKPSLTPIWKENDDVKRVLGSSPFVPSSGGLLLAYEVAKDLTGF